jgi:hypothetical protein
MNPQRQADLSQLVFCATNRQPGYPINFVWMMAAHREVEDRQFGVVTVQPGLDGGGSGLEASRK